jgi:hypothetical protein
MDAMVSAHDQVVRRYTREPVYAGRLGSELRENAWKTVLEQRDLIAYFLTRLETIARSNQTGEQLERTVKEHVYGVWAAFKKRLNRETQTYQPMADGSGRLAPVHMALMEAEVTSAFNDFVSRGVAMVGCGGRIEMLQGLDEIMRADSETIFDAVFGKEKGSSKDCDYISKKCPMCNARNVRTIDKGVGGNKRRISGSCGCSKVYIKA